MNKIESSILQTLREDEGFRAKAYQDTKGIWTIGYGTNLQVLTIDVETAEKWLEGHYREAEADCVRCIPFFGQLDAVRRGVLVSMVYQMGIGGVLKFKNFLKALMEGDHAKASEEILNSKWAREDSPARAQRHSKRVLKGLW